MFIPYKLHYILSRLFRQQFAEWWIKQRYLNTYGKNLITIEPQTYTDKLINRVLEINRGKYPLYTTLADKYLVRDYVSTKIGDNYLIKLFWHGSNPCDIPFDKLPEKCIIKTNHMSGEVIVFDQSIDRNQVIQQLQKLIKKNFYWEFYEYQYYKIPPLVLIEELLIDTEYENGPLDYRIWCFHGKPEVIQLDNHIHNIDPFYDTNWNKLAVSQRKNYVDFDFRRPDNLDEMLEIATKLSDGFDFIRVDLYNLSGKIYFGELTFTPRAGMFKFTPNSWDLIFGEKWNYVKK